MHVTRKTRSRAKSTDGVHSRPTSASAPQTRVRKRAGAMFPSLRIPISRTEMEEDLDQLLETYHRVVQRRKKAKTAPVANVRVVRERLLYNNLVIEDGDEVYVEWVAEKRFAVGLVAAITPSELFLIEQNEKYRVVSIMGLRLGQFKLRVMKDSSEEDEDGY